MRLTTHPKPLHDPDRRGVPRVAARLDPVETEFLEPEAEHLTGALGGQSSPLGIRMQAPPDLTPPALLARQAEHELADRPTGLALDRRQEIDARSPASYGRRVSAVPSGGSTSSIRKPYAVDASGIPSTGHNGAMVVIFGWGAGKAQDLGEVAPTTCPNCHNQVFLHHIKSDKKISLYFVPLVKYGSDEYLACPICKAGVQIPPAQREAVVRMKGTTSAFRRQVIPLATYQPMVDQFWRTMGVNPSGQQVLQPTATIPPPAAPVAAPVAAAPGVVGRRPARRT